MEEEKTAGPPAAVEKILTRASDPLTRVAETDEKKIDILGVTTKGGRSICLRGRYRPGRTPTDLANVKGAVKCEVSALGTALTLSNKSGLRHGQSCR